MRMLLLLAVVALGYDAVNFDGAYTQRAWREISSQVSNLRAELDESDILDRRVALTAPDGSAEPEQRRD